MAEPEAKYLGFPILFSINKMQFFFFQLFFIINVVKRI